MDTTLPCANGFKAALRSKVPSLGLWMGLADALAAEICAGSGAGWLLIDGEHAPNDLPAILAQLQAIHGYAAHPVVRVVNGHGEAGAAVLKQVLDLGAQTVMVPMVETQAQAEAVVRAVRYPPEGIRGMAIGRASRWGRWADYAGQANREVCLLLQVESVAGLDQLEAIAGTDGVDGIFIGPGDLAASMGHLGASGHEAVRAEVKSAIRRIRACGRAAGAMSLNEQYAAEYLEAGASFLAVGFDAHLLAKGSSDLVARFAGPLGMRPCSIK